MSVVYRPYTPWVTVWHTGTRRLPRRVDQVFLAKRLLNLPLSKGQG